MCLFTDIAYTGGANILRYVHSRLAFFPIYSQILPDTLSHSNAEVKLEKE